MPRKPPPAPHQQARQHPGWQQLLAAPAVPALTATAVVGLAAGAFWAHASTDSQAGPLPSPRPTVTLVKTLPAPAPAATARQVAQVSPARVTSTRVAPPTRAAERTVRQVRVEHHPAPAKPKSHGQKGEHRGEAKGDGGDHHGGHGQGKRAKSTSPKGGKGEDGDHHAEAPRPRGSVEQASRGPDQNRGPARREHDAHPQRSHPS